MPYSIDWLESVFTSRERTLELLSPEVENGVLTYHDYEVAVDYLPSHRRYYGFITILAGLTCSAYGSRKKWSLGKNAGITIGASILGQMAAELPKLHAHRRFLTSLDDSKGFSQACENIHRRLGSPLPLGFEIQTGPFEKLKKRDTSIDSGENHEHEGDKPDWQKVYRDAGKSMASESINPSPDVSIRADSDNAPNSSWDGIRKANLTAAKNSSWDAIRQDHERAKVAEKQRSKTSPPTNTFNAPRTEDERRRAFEQAKFDALLEAERNIKSAE